jgi:hypothetical protein
MCASAGIFPVSSLADLTEDTLGQVLAGTAPGRAGGQGAVTGLARAGRNVPGTPGP